jgi:hypothetical protein
MMNIEEFGSSGGTWENDEEINTWAEFRKTCLPDRNEMDCSCVTFPRLLKSDFRISLRQFPLVCVCIILRLNHSDMSDLIIIISLSVSVELRMGRMAAGNTFHLHNICDYRCAGTYCGVTSPEFMKDF